MHQHGVYTADWRCEPVLYVERCPRCGRTLSTEPRTRGFYFHEGPTDRATCPDAIDMGDGSPLACPGHVLDEDGKQVATMRPMTLQRLASAARRGDAGK
jgi:hypothetical protein